MIFAAGTDYVLDTWGNTVTHSDVTEDGMQAIKVDGSANAGGWGSVIAFNDAHLGSLDVTGYENLVFKIKGVDKVRVQIVPVETQHAVTTEGVAVAGMPGWYQMTIPVPSGANGEQFAIYGHVGDNANGTTYQDAVYFLTDIGFTGTAVAPPADMTPTDAPATPTAAASGVVSLYSDAYTDAASNTTPGWSEVVTDETYANNNVKKTTNFLPFALTAPIDISTQTTMHVDVWLPELPSAGAGLLIKLLDAANGPHEANYTHPVANLTAGQWNSIDIPMSSFVQTQGTWDATAQSRVDQVLVDIVDDATMYVDNVYFYGGTTAPPPAWYCNDFCSRNRLCS